MSEFEDEFRSLGDDELVEEGDIVKDIEIGAYLEVATGTYHAMLIGEPAGVVRKWRGVNDVMRRLSREM